MQGGLGLTSTSIGALGVIQMDVVVNFSDGSGLISETKMNNGTHWGGTPWGSWSLVSGDTITYTSIQNHSVRFPGTIRCGGIDYDGSEGQGLTFDFSSEPTTNERFDINLTEDITNCVAVMLIRYATVVHMDFGYNNDTLMIAGSTYSIAQLQQAFFGPFRFLKAHSEGDLGAGVDLSTDRWAIVSLRHNVDAQRAEFYVQDAATLEVLGASMAEHSIPAGDVVYIRLGSYSRGANSGTGSIAIKLLAMRQDATWPAYAIMVPRPTSIAASQTGANEITATWSNPCQVFKVERNVNSGGWTTLDAFYSSQSVPDSSYEDGTVSTGQSVQYRVTTLIGNQVSSAVTTNTVVVS